MQFSMLLGTQVVGCHMAKGFTGAVKISTQNEMATAWLNSGSVTGLRNSQDSEAAALNFLSRTTSGEATTKSDLLGTGKTDYPFMLEEQVFSGRINYSSLLPLSGDIFCLKGGNFDFGTLKSAPGLKNLLNLVGSGIAFPVLASSLQVSDFWGLFVLATSIGAIIPSYHKLLGEVVKKYQEAIDAEIKRFMGIAISHSFSTKVDKAVVDWRESFTDPSFGAKPFEAWAKAIVISVNDTVPTTISEKMLMKVLSTFAPNDQKTISTLIS